MHSVKPSALVRLPSGARHRNRCVLAASIAGLISGVSPHAASVAHAEVVWRGDFETQDFSQWDFELRPEGLSIVSDPVAEGSYALRVELTSETVWDNGKFRTELQHKPEASRASEGAELFFGWSIYLPEPLPTGAEQDYQLGYFETTGTNNQVFSLHAIGEGLILSLNHDPQINGWIEQGTLDTGKWHRIVYQVKWSSDANQGFVSLWLDGVKLVDQAHARTFIDNQPAFIQLGLLKNPPAPPQPVVLYVDAAMEGDTYADVSLGIAESEGPMSPLPEDPAPDPTEPAPVEPTIDPAPSIAPDPSSGVEPDVSSVVEPTGSGPDAEPDEPFVPNPQPPAPSNTPPPPSTPQPGAQIPATPTSPASTSAPNAPSATAGSPNVPAPNGPPAMPTVSPSSAASTVGTSAPASSGAPQDTSDGESTDDGGGCGITPSENSSGLFALALAFAFSVMRRRRR